MRDLEVSCALLMMMLSSSTFGSDDTLVVVAKVLSSSAFPITKVVRRFSIFLSRWRLLDLTLLRSKNRWGQSGSWVLAIYDLRNSTNLNPFISMFINAAPSGNIAH